MAVLPGHAWATRGLRLDLAEMVTHAPTVANIEERCRSVGMTLSGLARRSDVSARKIWEARLSAVEHRRVEAVLDEVERQAAEEVR